MICDGVMIRVNQIWNHPEYQKCLREIEKYERERKFCRHTPEHFMDVGRLTYIYVLEAGIDISKEEIYAAALLHDIGRHLQYSKGIPHEIASAEIAKEILNDVGFTEKEQEQILEAILSHRKTYKGDDFPGLFYKADKRSRSCFMCKAEKECNWSAEKKNMDILE